MTGTPNKNKLKLSESGLADIIMEQKEIRIRVHPVLHKKMRMVCAKNDLSMNKQISELIRKFVEIQEENERLMKG